MPQTFRHIGIIGKLGAIRVQDALARTVAVLEQRGLRYSLDPDTVPPEYQIVPAVRPISAWDDVDLCIVIGGDGTFLYASRALIDRQIPLIGIHTGRLGFLADLTLDDLADQLDRILAGHYHCEQRHTLRVTIEGRDGSSEHLAINDAVIRSSKAQMIELDVYNHDRYLSHYRADGLTPAPPPPPPPLPVSLVVPICPHTLTQRPVVIDANSPITITPGAKSSGAQLSIDGQQQHRLHHKDRITIRAGIPLPVLHPENYHFQDRLRAKLNWGIAPEDSHG